jgi:hypothetical protein
VSLQPQDISLENGIAIMLTKPDATGNPHFAVAQEHHNVAPCVIPDAIRDSLRESLLVFLEATLGKLSINTRRKYKKEAQHLPLNVEEQELAKWAACGLANLGKINKRLGGSRYGELRKVMKAAIEAPHRRGRVVPRQARHAARRQLPPEVRPPNQAKQQPVRLQRKQAVRYRLSGKARHSQAVRLVQQIQCTTLQHREHNH